MKEVFIITKTSKVSPTDEVTYYATYYATGLTPVWVESKFEAHRFAAYVDAQNTIIKSVVIKSDEMLQIEKLFVN